MTIESMQKRIDALEAVNQILSAKPCAHCGETMRITVKRITVKRGRKGYRRESPAQFAVRKYCSSICVGLAKKVRAKSHAQAVVDPLARLRMSPLWIPAAWPAAVPRPSRGPLR